MTIEKIIREVDTIKPNKYTREDKIRWLSDLDGMIKKNIIDTHKDDEDVSFSEYTDTTTLSTELLVKAPYDIIYRWYLNAQIDLNNQEIEKYNNSIMLYNAAYEDFKKYYNRNHMPKSNPTIKLIRG